MNKEARTDSITDPDSIRQLISREKVGKKWGVGFSAESVEKQPHLGLRPAHAGRTYVQTRKSV